MEKSPIEQRYSMLSVAHWFSFSNPPLTAENGITDICSAVFVFCGPNNGPQILAISPFISKVLMTFRLNIGVILTETKKTETVPTALPLL